MVRFCRGYGWRSDRAGYTSRSRYILGCPEEGNELLTICNQLKMRETDVADMQGFPDHPIHPVTESRIVLRGYGRQYPFV